MPIEHGNRFVAMQWQWQGDLSDCWSGFCPVLVEAKPGPCPCALSVAEVIRWSYAWPSAGTSVELFRVATKRTKERFLRRKKNLKVFLSCYLKNIFFVLFWSYHKIQQILNVKEC